MRLPSLGAVASCLLPLSLASFTPADLLSAPRHTVPVPNKAGTLGLYSTTSYCFGSHKKTTTWSVLNITSGQSTDIYSGFTGAIIWLGTDDESVLLANTTSDGQTNLVIGNCFRPEESYKAGALPGAANHLKTSTQEDALHLVFVSKADKSGAIYNPKKAPKKHSSGMVFESLYVRHWDEYVTQQKDQLFSAVLVSKKDRYQLGPYVNLFGPGSPLESPVKPFGGGADFDISPMGHVAFVSKTPNLNPANNTQTLVYVVPLSGSKPPAPINSPDGTDCDGNALPQGASSSPKFSPDGHALAYLQMYENGYESDINKIFVARHKEGTKVIAKDWDVSPGSFRWTPNGLNLYATADHHGRVKLFNIPLDDSDITEVWGKHAVHSVDFLPGDKLLIGMSSLVSSLRPYVYCTKTETLTPLMAQPLHEQKLKESQVETFNFWGADDELVHGFIVKPSNFNRYATYRMAFFIHGGPQGAWSDAWSTRWNPAVFAEYGFVVVAVNPSGSTGYGKKFTDSIQGEWGGKPYIDLEKAIQFLDGNFMYNYIDFHNMVALGASYGGYMINYIQGMPLGRRFKALVCHDGVFSTLNQFSSEELYFPQHEFQGTLWNNRAGYEKWDPARLLDNWATPQMIIHNEKDYRLPITEGLSAFNVLQEKGIPSKLLIFPDENHWVLNHENSLMWHKEVFEWIDRWTLDKAQHVSIVDSSQQRIPEEVFGEL